MATYTPNPSWLRAMDTAIEQVEKRSTDLEKFSKDYKAELKAAVDAMADITLGDVPQPAFIPVPIEPAPEANLSAPPVFPTSNLQLPSAPERPQFMDVDSALGNLPQFPDVPVFGGLYIPPAPTMGQHALPARPQVDDVVLPDEPSLVLPTMGQLKEITIPDAPKLAIEDFTAVAPVADALAVPEVLLNWKEPEYKSEVLPDLVEWVKRYMQGGTGLPAPVENALFGRARDRLTAETNVAVQEAVESWAARGFTMPPGMLAAQADAIRAKAQLQAAELNRDIMVEAAKWEIENIRFAVQQGMALEQLLQNMFENMAKRLFEAARFHAQAQIDVFNARVSLFNAQLQAYNTAAQVYKTKVDATLSRVQLFKAQVDAAIAQGQLNEQAVSVFKAQITAVQAQAEMFATKMRGAQTKADVVKAKIDAYRAAVQAFAELVGAEKVKFDAYSSQIAGEKAKADAFDSLARAHAATISGIAAQADLKVKQVQLHIENNRNHATIYGADTDRYQAEVNASLSQVKEQLAAFQAEASAWESSERVKVANAQMKQSYNESVMRTNIANAEMQLKQFEANMQQAYQKAQIALEGAKAAGQYAAQLAAGAMSALHVSASVGGTGSQSSSESHSYNDSESTNYNYSY